MCGIVGFWDKSGLAESRTGQVVLTMLDALACRGPDSAGMAVIGPEPASEAGRRWWIRVATDDERALDRLAEMGSFVPAADGAAWDRQGRTLRFSFRPLPGVTV